MTTQPEMEIAYAAQQQVIEILYKIDGQTLHDRSPATQLWFWLALQLQIKRLPVLPPCGGTRVVRGYLPLGEYGHNIEPSHHP
jgi:hypothetical protein